MRNSLVPTKNMHHREIANTLLIWGFVQLASPTSAAGEVTEAATVPNQCDTQSVDQQLTETFGSVGVFANLRGQPGSIRAVAAQLLTEALNASPQDDTTCPVGCEPGPATIVYKVQPTAFLSETKQRQICLGFERRTIKKPLHFPKKRFASVDDLNEWIMDFSRGKGPEGKQLYQLCASNCSPRYTFLIDSSHDGAYHVASEVICGLARDRSNKRYSLSTFRRSNCSDPSE